LRDTFTGQQHRFYLAARAEPAAVPLARRRVRHTLATWRLDHLAADTELVVSELLTNAVRAAAHEAAPVALYLALDLDRLFVLVWDCCPEPLVRCGQAGAEAEGGRGLEIVQAISDRWGTCTPAEGGKVVWAQLSATGSDAK
jgi:anti-sigma regulatory factor (Ser/Thr protein kinase)